MSKLPRSLNCLAVLAISPLLASSCSDRDPLVHEMVRQQSTHHEIVARQSEELTKASRELVEADAKSRREQAEQQAQLQFQLETQRQGLSAQRDALESERREIAQHRYRDPLIAAALVQVATLLIAALPLVLLVLLIRAARSEPTDAPLGELIVHDLTSDVPLLLPAPLREPPATLLTGPDFPPALPTQQISPDDGSMADPQPSAPT